MIDGKCSNLENKCYYCKTNYEKVKLTNQLIIDCGSDRHKFVHNYNKFNDSFLIRNLPLYCDCIVRGSKEYCNKWVKEFKQYIKEKK